MNKNYKERLQLHIEENLGYEILSQLQKEIDVDYNNNDYNLYDSTSEVEAKVQTLAVKHSENKEDIDTKYSLAFKLFLEKFMKDNQQDINNLEKEQLTNQVPQTEYIVTANKNIYQDRNGNYFKLINKKYEKQDNIFSVLEDGSYVTKNTIKTCYTLYTTFNKQDCPIALKLLRKDAPVYMAESIIALDLKKEVVQKAKRIGYSGHSFDLIANIINTFVAPVESGYYMDNKYRFYKWNFKKACFEIHYRDGKCIGSPNLADYEPKGKIVIRTDYNGSGLYC